MISINGFGYTQKVDLMMHYFGSDAASFLCLQSPLCVLTQCPAHNTIGLVTVKVTSYSLSALNNLNLQND